VLARLFIVLLLAFSLGAGRTWTAVDAPVAIEMIEGESVAEGGEVVMTRVATLRIPVARSVAFSPPVSDETLSSPDIVRVFRPPRLLGS
jgi:hypothetical protein